MVKTKKILVGSIAFLLCFLPLFSQTVPGTDIENVASAEYRDAGGFVYSVQSPPVITTVSPGSALTLSKYAEKTVFLPLDTVTYHLRLTNSGNIAASSVTILDSLPAGLNYLSSQPPASVSANVLSWNLLNLQAGATEDITLSALVAPAVPSGTLLENTAHYHTPDDAHGSSLPFAIRIDALPDLRLEKRVDRSSAESGDTLRYSITLGNFGNLSTTNTRIYDNLPPESDLVSASGNATYQSGILSWDLGLFEPGDEFEEQLLLLVRDGVPAGNSIVNTAYVTNSEGIERNASANTLISEPPQLSELWIEKSAASTAGPDDTLIYHIVFGNRGNATATALVVSDSLDAQLMFLDADGAFLYDAAKHQVSWNLGDLGAGEKDSLQLRAKTDPGIPDGTQIRNTVTIRSDGVAPVSAEWDITVLSPSLSLEKTASLSTVNAGDALEYGIAYRNTGNGLARDVIIRDTLSADVQYVAASGNVSYDPGTGVVSWQIGTLPENMAAAQSQSLQVRVRSPLPNGTLIENRAVMSSREGFSAAGAVTATVASTPVLSLTKTAPAAAFPGDTLQYRIAFANTGNAAATQTIIRDTLANELEFLRADGVYNYDPLRNAVSWNIGDLATDIDSAFTLEVRIAPSLSGVHLISNTASIHAQESNLRSNTVQTTVRSLHLQISADPDSILGNGESYSSIRANLTDASGQPAADGSRIVFRSSAGSFAAGTDTVQTLNGIAETRLYSERIDREFLPLTIKAELLQNTAARISDSTTVIFFSRTLVGFVSNSDNEPAEGAVVILLQNDQVQGTDTTGADGYYSIPIFSSGSYTIIVSYVDQYGITRTVEYEVEIVIDESGQTRIIPDKCLISGNIIDQIRQQPIPEAGIPVIIRRLESGGMGKRSADAFRDTTVTDSSGFWSFNGLELGTYSIETMYGGSGYYHAGIRQITLDAPGQYLINADLALRPIIMQSYKKVDKAQAMSGDTLHYRIYYSTQEYPVSDTIRITDILPEQVEWIPASMKLSPALQLQAYDAILGELNFRRIGMPADEGDSIVFAVRIRSDLNAAGVNITNRAELYYGIDTVRTAEDARSMASTKIVSPFLFVKKNVNRRVAETGDVLSYTVTIENRSSETPLFDLHVMDQLPPGFRYREDRSTGNGTALEDPRIASLGAGRLILVWELPDTLQPGASYELRYRVIVGLDSRLGENENIVWAQASMPGGSRIGSAEASAAVILKPGMIHERGFIFGKVFYDLNGNHMHDHAEPVVKGVEIVTEEGIRVITDEYGKYSIPNVRTGDHVLRINRKTLPENSELHIFASAFLGDASSRLVKVRPSGIAKANFILESAEAMPVSEDRSGIPDTSGRTTKISDSSGETEKPLPVSPGTGSVKTADPTVQAVISETSEATKIPEIPEKSPGIEAGKTLPAQKAPAENTAELAIRQHSLTNSFRLLAYHAWNITLHLEFSPGGTVPTPQDECIMDQLVDFLKWQDHLHVRVKGHTDNTPVRLSSFRDNQTLSQARAERVMQYLLQQGIAAERMKAIGCGDSEPLESNATAEGREANRRVELVFLMENAERYDGTGIAFDTEITYDGAVSLYQARLVTRLPEGFRDADAGEGPVTGNASVYKDLGDLTEPVRRKFSFCLVPDDHRKIHAVSTVQSILEYLGPEGIRTETRTLQIRIPTLVEEALFNIVLKGANFSAGSANLSYNVLPALNKLGEFMIWQEQMHIRVEGFTDSTGTEEKNLELASRRAEAVKRYLVTHFAIDPARIKTRSYGEAFPIADNGSPQGRIQNRRVEIIIESEFIQKGKEETPVRTDSLQQRIEGSKTGNLKNKRKNKP
ncbi:MAG: OmpA family protein [Candidatus Neomarinimicrobiota bacterium]|nr:OmpA family protein [Candidatus Neomarinimicrobiota bacterium]